MGNIAAGLLAKKCGLKIANFVGSVNVNDITHRVRDYEYDLNTYDQYVSQAKWQKFSQGNRPW